MATLLDKTSNTFKQMGMPYSFVREQAFPLDPTSVWYSFKDAIEYVNNDDKVPYYGQVLSVVDSVTHSVELYKIVPFDSSDTLLKSRVVESYTNEPVATKITSQNYTEKTANWTAGLYRIDHLTGEDVDRATTSSFGVVQVGDNISVSNGVISIPKATASSLGVIKPGTHIAVDANGAISVITTDSVSSNNSSPITSGAVYSKIESLDHVIDNTGLSGIGVVQSVSEVNGIVTVKYGYVTNDDIENSAISTGKINGLDTHITNTVYGIKLSDSATSLSKDNNHNITIPNVTTTSDGLMSSEDKVILNTLNTNANKYQTIKADDNNTTAPNIQTDTLKITGGDGLSTTISNTDEVSVNINLNSSMFEVVTDVIGLKNNGIENGKLSKAPVSTIKGSKNDSNATSGYNNVVDLTVSDVQSLLNDSYSTNSSLANKSNVNTAISNLVSSFESSIPRTGTASATYPATSSAVKEYVDATLSYSDALVFKGTIGPSANNPTLTSLPMTGYSAGWVYKVIGSYTYGSNPVVTCEIGDMIVAIHDAPNTASSITTSDWTVIQTNIDGAVVGPNTSTGSNIAVFNGTTGKLISDGGKTVNQLTVGAGTGLSESGNRANGTAVLNVVYGTTNNTAFSGSSGQALTDTIGTASDASTANTVYGKINQVSGYLGTPSDTSSSTTAYGYLKALEEDLDETKDSLAKFAFVDQITNTDTNYQANTSTKLIADSAIKDNAITSLSFHKITQVANSSTDFITFDCGTSSTCITTTPSA